MLEAVADELRWEVVALAGERCAPLPACPLTPVPDSTSNASAKSLKAAAIRLTSGIGHHHPLAQADSNWRQAYRLAHQDLHRRGRAALNDGAQPSSLSKPGDPPGQSRSYRYSPPASIPAARAPCRTNSGCLDGPRD